LNIRINKKKIVDRCGAVSAKRGETFYRSDKVRLEEIAVDYVKATVHSTEEFHVTIRLDQGGELQAECNCPNLSSFSKDCQHIASVLYALNDHKTSVTDSSEIVQENSLTQELIHLFGNKVRRASRKQQHFEQRKLVHVEFGLQLVRLNDDTLLFGIELIIEGQKIEDMNAFLKDILEGRQHTITHSLTYDPDLYCFSEEADAVIWELIRIRKDAMILGESEHGILMIPPSVWERLESLLMSVSHVSLKTADHTFYHLEFVDEALPLTFYFTQAEQDSHFQLEIKGLHALILLPAYRTAIMDGKLMMLKAEESQRLFELKKMLEHSGTGYLSIPMEQMNVFMEKIVPELKKIGEVHLSDSIIKHYEKQPLTGRLYLDRIKNRLLAGLEFQYGQYVVNPLEKETASMRPMIVREVDKENEIMKLMEESSFTKTEEGYFLQNEELEYEFLYHQLPKLQSLVEIYATTAVRNRIVKSPQRPKIRVKHKRDRVNWLEFTFEMEGFPEKEIRDMLQAIEEKRKYYRLKNGSLMSLETREMEEIRQFLHAVPIQDEELASGFDVPITKGLQLIDIMQEEAITLEDSFREFLDKIHHPDQVTFPVPAKLESVLRSYQKHGYRWMKALASFGFGGILADDMGLGKTLQSITYIVSVLEESRKMENAVLVVCPSSVTYNWLHELMKFAPTIQAVVMDGNKATRSKLQRELFDIDVLITSYPMLRSDIQWFEKQQFHTVFFDEAQAFKNPMTQTARAVKKVQADHYFALTGTPLENSLEDLWSIFHVVFPELFGSLKEYSELSRKKITRRIRPFMLRRVKEEVIGELPEKQELTVSVDMLTEQKVVYGAYLAKLRHKTLKHLDKDTFRKNRIRILAGLTRLRQICCHPALFVEDYQGGSAKLDRLMRILEEARMSGRRVLIFSQFTKMLDIIGRELTQKGETYFYLDGHTPSEKRVEQCNRFNEGERDIFLISLKAGGTGLNLTGADTVILYDLWWNPAVEEQAADRAHRIGQRKTVQVIKLVASGTIEEKMNELQEKKHKLIEEIIDPEDQASITLTDEDIRWCLSLPEFCRKN